MLGLSPGQRDVVVLAVVLKVLLYPAYRSTDFEVHRNWLAITHNLPLSRWYYDTTSQWTLDYPPFFAYFSYLLTLPARFLLPASTSSTILKLSSQPIEDWATVIYMRTTVLISESCLALGLLRLCRPPTTSQTDNTTALLILFHPGFLILDSIHFQYNAFLFGIMIWSLVGAKEGKPWMCAAFFAALLNLKHIYVYLAPAWFIYLLRGYCWIPAGDTHLSRLLHIGATTISVFGVSLGPFLWLGQGKQLLARLFPFTRGLMHAYWAPNAWALVALLDRALLFVSRYIPIISPSSISHIGISSTSRGLVGDTNFAIVPDIKPVHCFALTALSQVLLLSQELWRDPSYTAFLRGIVHCGFASFMFGWHVHEKAIMLVLVPLSLLAKEDRNHFRAFVVASVAGIYSLFPLLFSPAETPVKLGYSFVWLMIGIVSLQKQMGSSTIKSTSLIEVVENIYMAGFIPLQIFTSVVHPYILSRILRDRWEFLPLMLTSIYCSLGVWWSWMRLGVASWRSRGDLGHERKVQ